MSSDRHITITSQTESASGWQFAAEVEGKHFAVTLGQEYYKKFQHRFRSPGEFIQAAFVFLLERESVDAILSSFDARDIEKYFPEFPGLMGGV